MRVVVVGCGSIGARHASVLAEMVETAVVDTDPARARTIAEQTGARCFDEEIAEALAWGPQGVVVATPHAHHVTTALAAVRAGADVLIEKPIAIDLSDAKALLREAEALGRRVWVVCNMRYHPGVQALREALPQIGRPLFARAHFGSFLPEMRPGVDYRRIYAADPIAGGVVLDGVHELDYVSWLLGSPISAAATSGRIGGLEIEAEDYASIMLTHLGGARSEIHLDYLRRFKRRGCEIVGTDASLDWSSEGKAPEQCSVTLFTPTGERKTLLQIEAVNVATPFVEMQRDFVAALGGNPNTLHTGVEAIRVLEAALIAKRGGGHVTQILE